MKNICDWNNCKEIGAYKAPVEKDNSKKFRMLCLEHVKEFNKNWNYFSGMNDEQVINFLKSDMIWHKPTQSFSSSDNFFKVLWNNTLKDEFDKDKFKSDYNHMRQFKFDHKDIKAFGILGVSVGLKWNKIQDKFKVLWNNTLKDELDKDKFKSDYNNMRQFKFDHKDIKAFGILGVSVGLKWQKIQDKFKVLVKKFHPDMNSGNKKYEEKLKLITLAYTQLKNTYREKIDT